MILFSEITGWITPVKLYMVSQMNVLPYIQSQMVPKKKVQGCLVPKGGGGNWRLFF